MGSILEVIVSNLLILPVRKLRTEKAGTTTNVNDVRCFISLNLAFLSLIANYMSAERLPTSNI